MLLINIFLLLLSNSLTIRKDVSLLYSRVCILILTYSILSTYESYYIPYIEKGLGLYNGLFNATAITQTFQNFILISSLVILSLTSFHLRKLYGYKTRQKNFAHKIGLIINKMAEQYTIIEYALVILFIVMGGTLLLSSGDNISLFLCIELQSYGLYILCVIYRDSESATSSGLTYFLLGGLSSCFILLGIAFIYVNTGVTNLDSFFVLTNLTTSSEYTSFFYDSQYITYSLLIISVGLLFKIGAAPFHFWSPDVYDGIPTIVTTFVANMAKISILILMLEIVHYTSETLKKITFDWTTGLTISCLLSLVIGTVLGLTQTRIKRLFAYSTISHLGFILLALSVNTIESSKAFIFYLIQYTISNINVFIILIAIGVSLYFYIDDKTVRNESKEEINNINKEENREEKSTSIKLQDKNNSPIQLIKQIKGYFYINPILALCLSIVMLSFVGLPPLIGFFAKQMVLSSALDNGFIFLVLISVITSVIGAVYYLGIIKTVFFEKNDYKEIKSDINFTLSGNLSVPISIITLLILLYILIANESIYLSNILSIISFAENDSEVIYKLSISINSNGTIKIEYPSINSLNINWQLSDKNNNINYTPFPSNNTLSRDWIYELVNNYKSSHSTQFKGWVHTPYPVKCYNYLDIAKVIANFIISTLPDINLSNFVNKIDLSPKLGGFINGLNDKYSSIMDMSATFTQNIIVYTMPAFVTNNPVPEDIGQMLDNFDLDAVLNHIRYLADNNLVGQLYSFLVEICNRFPVDNTEDEISYWPDIMPVILSYNNLDFIYLVGYVMAHEVETYATGEIMGIIEETGNEEAVRIYLQAFIDYAQHLREHIVGLLGHLFDLFIQRVRTGDIDMNNIYVDNFGAFSDEVQATLNEFSDLVYHFRGIGHALLSDDYPLPDLEGIDYVSISSIEVSPPMGWFHNEVLSHFIRGFEPDTLFVFDLNWDVMTNAADVPNILKIIPLSKEWFAAFIIWFLL